MSTNCCINCQSKRLAYQKETDIYKCLDCGYEYPKQYFFISHSHLDIEKVRIIRNIVEETFFYEPILFFLKCLSDENEIQSLIQREINERIWFVYCDSENARKSEYVQKEREIVEKLIAGGKKINLLNIELDKFNIWDDGCYDYIRRQISYRIRKTKVFISYQHKNSLFAEKVKNALSERGFSVWTDLDMTAGDLWNVSVNNAIKEHSYKNGLFLLLSSESDVNSFYVKRELETAVMHGSLVLPVLFGGAKMNAFINLPINSFLFDESNFDKEIERLISVINDL